MITYGKPDLLHYLNTYCVKAELRGLSVTHIDPTRGIVTLKIPVIRGDLEQVFGGEDRWVASVDLEYDYDGEWVTLYKFPENLLDDEDYNFICECIMEEVYDDADE